MNAVPFTEICVYLAGTPLLGLTLTRLAPTRPPRRHEVDGGRLGARLPPT